MKKAALWLADMVGEGEVFTKDELREAFPGVSQIDRRVRDLRDHGWIINTRSEDLDLELDEQRLVRIGGHVWAPGYRSPVKPVGPTPKQRAEAFQASNHSCLGCGVAAGEPFTDDVLSIAKLTVVGSMNNGWISSCQRCKQGKFRPSSLEEFLSTYSALTSVEKRTFAEWVDADLRMSSPLDLAWSNFRRLGAAERPDAMHIIRSEVQERRGRYSA